MAGGSGCQCLCSHAGGGYVCERSPATCMTLGRKGCSRMGRDNPTSLFPALFPPALLDDGGKCGIILLVLLVLRWPYHYGVRSGRVSLPFWFVSGLDSISPFFCPLLLSQSSHWVSGAHLPPRMVMPYHGCTVPDSTLGLLLQPPGPDRPHCDPIATAWDSGGTTEVVQYRRTTGILPRTPFHHSFPFP